MMAREDLDVDESSMVGHLTAPLRTGPVKTRIVRRATQSMTRAVPGSQGKKVEVVDVNPPDLRHIDDWLPDRLDVQGGKETGFARWSSMQVPIESESTDRFPVEYQMDPIAEEKRILAAVDRIEKLERVQQDPVTKVPENWAAVDRVPESDKFFGKEKSEPETSTVLNRMKNVDRTKEKVDYVKSKAVPIKFMGNVKGDY